MTICTTTKSLLLPIAIIITTTTTEAFTTLHPIPKLQPTKSTTSLSIATDSPPAIGTRISINESFPNLQQIYSNPDIFLIPNFLDNASCQDLITRAKEKTLQPSPVAYAGWTTDFKDLVELAMKGPVSWLAILGAWLQTKDDTTASQIDLVVHMVQNFGILLLVAVVGIGIFTKSRADGLQKLRTSTSTTLDDLDNENSGTTVFVKQSALLFGGGGEDNVGTTSPAKEARLFEAPTVIRYESGQVLAPHYDANRSAETEDANRGGQTLATLLVYLNDVEEGGLTRFGKLPARTTTTSTTKHSDETSLTIQPTMGDALLFFPADADGNFDERTEHEGCPAVDEKWIARIWRHMNRVPPPFGLSEDALANV